MSAASDRRSAEILVAVADAATTASVACLATNAFRPGTPLLSQVLIVIWAAAPRAVAAGIRPTPGLFKKGQKLAPSELIIGGAICLAMTVGIFALGTIPGVARTGSLETALLAMCWIAGFSLRSPGAYAIWEPLVLATALLSLVPGPAMGPWLVASAFVGICLSGAIRRQLAASTDRTRARRIDLRIARRVAALLAILLIASFLLADRALRPVLGSPEETKPVQQRPSRLERPPGAGPSAEARGRRRSEGPERESGGRGSGAGEEAPSFDERSGGFADEPEERPRERNAWFDKPLPDWLIPVLGAVALVLLMIAWTRRKKTVRPRREEEQLLEEEFLEAPAAPAFIPTTAAGRLLVEYGRLQDDLAVVGQQRRVHETPREHARRVSPPEKPQPRTAFADVVPLIDDGLYGKVELTDADFARGCRDLDEIRRSLRD